MTKRIIIVITLLILGIPYAQSQSQTVQIIPIPNSIEMGTGAFTLDKKTSIAYLDNSMKETAGYLSNGIEKSNGNKLSISKKQKGKNQIVLKTNPAVPASAYRITVTDKTAVCEASDNEGMFYAIQSVLQSITQEGGKTIIPVMTINDAPRYAWRGMMLDESRHFFGKEVVKNLLDVMAYLKMNRFHWHLTDEPGWRIEIKKYPELTRKGAEGNWHDRKAPLTFYTQDEIKEIVAYAAERHIMVIPEIDMPGHATAASRAYPWLSAGGKGQWDGFTFHPAKETTYQFLNDVFTEVAELFPGPYIHIGGDEVHYGNQTWFTDPVIQQFIKDNGLKNELGLEHYFVRRACDMVNSKGKIMIGWDEIIHSGVTPDKAIAMWWRQDKQDQLTLALEKGFNVIMTPRLPCYFDFVQHNSQKIGRRWGKGYNTLENVYAFPDNISQLIKNKPEQVMGLQSSLWTERVADTKRLYYMLFPRVAAIAEDTWTNSESKDYPQFELRLKGFLKYLDSKKINYFNPFDVESTPEPWGPDKVDIIANG